MHRDTNTVLRRYQIYQCSHCDDSFSNNSNLVAHIRTHTGEGPYQCSNCGKAFEQPGIRITRPRTHIMSTIYRSFIYPYCQCEKNLSEHRQDIKALRAQIVDKSYQCNRCDNTYLQYDKFIVHLKTHTTEKQYVITCHACYETNLDNHGFDIHMITHTGSKKDLRDNLLSDSTKKHAKIHELDSYLKLKLENKTATPPIKTEQDNNTFPEDQVSIKVGQELGDILGTISSAKQEELYNLYEFEVKVENILGTIHLVKQE